MIREAKLVRLLAVTERGFALAKEFRDIIQSKAREFLDCLSDEELAQMRDLFAAIEGRLREEATGS